MDELPWFGHRQGRLAGLLAIAVLLMGGCGAPIAPTLDAYGLIVTSDRSGAAARPLDGATVSGIVTIQVDDFDEVASVAYTVGSDSHPAETAVTSTGAPFAITLDTTSFSNGSHIMSAVVHHESGSSRHVTATFTITNDTNDAEDAEEPGHGWHAWLSADIGVVGLEGESHVATDADSFTLRASGSDVWNNQDGFHFTYQQFTGDATLTTRVDAIEAAHEWTKVGVMIRENLAPDARNAFMLVTDRHGAVFQGRSETGARTTDTLPDGRLMATPEPTAPWWLRIQRQGDTLIGSHSPDGSTWTELGRLTLNLPHDTLIGMAVTSSNNEAVATGVFSNVILEPTTPKDDTDHDDIPDDSTTTLPPVPITGPTVTATYTRTNEAFPNPERGWYGYGGNTSGYARAASEGFTLVHRTVRLDDYRYQALPAHLLEDLRHDLTALREYGLKIILRFAYNHSFSPDAPRERVLQHIEQLTPILQEHTDVIAVLQAGFIGAWGEWHSSTHDLLTLENRTTITNALLNAIDESRMIQIRTPYLTRDMYPTPPTATNAFNGSDTSRVGQKNDCFLTNANDGGTYRDAADWTYAETVTRYTATGGETCSMGGLNSHNDGDVAITQLARFHYDYLNHNFWTPIIDKWRHQGHYHEISQRLGYRYVMHTTTSQATAQPGHTYSLNIRIQNEGFGKLYNPRPINIILQPTHGGPPITLRAHDDARQTLPPPGETHTLTLTARLPTTLPTGTYDVHLHLPDAATTLTNDPRYAIRFANHHTWNNPNAHNPLNLQLTIND